MIVKKSLLYFFGATLATASISVTFLSQQNAVISSFAGGEYSCSLPANFHELSDICQIAVNANSDVTNSYQVRGTVTRSKTGATYIQRVNQTNQQLDSILLTGGASSYNSGNVLDISGGKLNNNDGVPYLNISTASVTVSYANNPTGYEPIEYDSIGEFSLDAFSRDTYNYSHFVQLNNVQVAFQVDANNLVILKDANDDSSRCYAEVDNNDIKNLLNDYYLRENVLDIKGVLSRSNSKDVLKIVSTSDVTVSGNHLRNGQKGTILQAWNWKINNIIDRLDDIKAAGYKNIQVSPLQPQKDYYSGGNWQDQWWKLYQPLGFEIAGDLQNYLGNETQLKELTREASLRGINIIMDVVVNHLAGDDWYTFSSGVSNYESTIVNQNLKHNLDRSPVDTDYQSIVQGHMGDYPDLQTESSEVQNRVIHLLEKYIDAGVRGFRFDAAKHIETPDDTYYSSNFWSNVIGTVNSYAQNTKGFTPYSYGEVLGAGNDRNINWYTPYISVTDSAYIYNVADGINNRNLDTIPSSFYGIDSSKVVVWPESHDTFKAAFKGGYATDPYEVNKAYAVCASKNNAASLYLARPNANTTFGDVGATDCFSNVVRAANIFHNEMVDASEYIKKDNGKYFINVRKGEEKSGVLIVNVTESMDEAINLNVDSNYMIPDGTYIDLIGGGTVNISNGWVNTNWNSCGVMALVTYTPRNVAIHGFGLKINGHPIMGVEQAEQDAQGRTQYKISNRAFRQGDTFTLYDFENDASWVEPIDSYSFNQEPAKYVSTGANQYTVLEDFTADIYIKIKYEDNQVYFGLTGMSLSTNSVNLQAGNQANVTVNNKNGDLVVTSSNTNIATVNVNGNTITVNGVASGSTTIKVQDDDNTRFISVTVSETPVSNDITVYFSKPKDEWSNTIKVYLFGPNNLKNADWPGQVATYVKNNEFGERIYSFTFEVGLYTNIIFNDGTNQTCNIPLQGVTNNTGFYVSGNSYGTYIYS